VYYIFWCNKHQTLYNVLLALYILTFYTEIFLYILSKLRLPDDNDSQMYENVSREVSLMQSIWKLDNHVDNGTWVSDNLAESLYCDMYYNSSIPPD